MLFDTSKLERRLIPGFRELAPLIGAELAESGGKTLTAERNSNNTLSVSVNANSCHITYHSLPSFFMGLSICAAHFGDENYQYNSAVRFSDLCAMPDCSRNAVLSVDGAKKMLRWLALLGFNSVMLYTEDTFEVDGYPYFGYMRGRYTKTEIREIIEYAEIFGISLIPCIQTLAHLNQALKWPAFNDVVDLQDILLAGDDSTYELIDALIGSCRQMFKSDIIHIGMDEAHMVGLGRYLDKHGYQNRFQIMTKHLCRVCDICAKYGLKPMMWSDMFFRLAFGGYYSNNVQELPAEVLSQIPQGVSMVYWDYYSHDPARYDSMFKNHQQLNNEVIFAGGAWSWKGFTPDNSFSIQATKAALESASRFGIQKVMATLWGDDGGECSLLSMLPTLAVYSHMNYCGEFSDTELHTVFKAVTGLSFDDFLAVDSLAQFDCIPESRSGINPAKYLLFQDCLAGLFDMHLTEGKTAEHYAVCFERLSSIAETTGDNSDWKQLFDAHAKLADVLTIKSELGIKIRKAYRGGDNDTLTEICRNTIPELISKIEAFYASYQKVWLLTNKPFGLDIQDIRYGGLIMRLKTVAAMLTDYINGHTVSIPELEEKILPYGYLQSLKPENPYIARTRWSDIVSPNVISHRMMPQ